MKTIAKLLRTRKRNLRPGDTALILTADSTTDDGRAVPAETVVEPLSAGEMADGLKYQTVTAISGKYAGEALTFVRSVK
jgi:hypothetical protein